SVFGRGARYLARPTRPLAGVVLYRLGNALEPEQATLFDNGGDFGWHEFLPAFRALFDQLEDPVRLNLQIALFIMVDVLDLVVGDEVSVQIDEMRRRVEPETIVDDPVAQRRIDEQFDIPAKERCKRFQDAA